MTMLKMFLPWGIVRARDWKSRFERIGFSGLAAWQAACTRDLRNALVDSRVELLPESLRNPMSLVVDVGANIGQWLSSFRHFVAVDQAEVFEPNPDAFEALTVRFGHQPGIHLHKTAIGERVDTLPLNLTRASSLSSLLQPSALLRAQYSAQGTEVVGHIPVAVTMLDSCIPPTATVDLLKIDVQGFERPVLRGASETLKRTRALLIEMNFVSHYEGDNTFGSLHEYITGEIGFEFWDLSPPHRGTEGQALWADAVFLNPAMHPAN